MSELEDWRKSDTRTLNFIEEKIPVMTPQVKIIQVFLHQKTIPQTGETFCAVSK